MRVIIIFVYCMLFFSPAIADTVDYYHVYINKLKVLDVSPARPDDLTFKINGIKSGDSISINYFRDTHCGSCSINLVLCDSTGLVLLKTSGNGLGNSLSFSLLEIVEYRRRNGSPLLILYYDEIHLQGFHKPTLLLKVHLE